MCWCKENLKTWILFGWTGYRGSIIPFCWVWTPRFFFEKTSHPEESTTLTGSALGWLPWNGQFAFRCWCALLTFAWTSKEGLHHLISRSPPTTSTPKNKKAELRATRPVTESRRQRDQGLHVFFWMKSLEHSSSNFLLARFLQRNPRRALLW